MTEHADIAVIGAGIAGITAARALSMAGHRPVVLDKGRGIGGRVATRRREGFSWDHGAQLVETDDPELEALLQRAEEDGACARWTGAGHGAPWIGLPGMSRLARHMAGDLEIRQKVEITTASRIGDRWHLQAGEHSLSARHVFSTIPAPQAARVFSSVPRVAETLQSVEFAPCWALLLAFETAPNWPVAARDPLPAFAWIASNASKPGRPDDCCWVVHASAAWSRAQLELTKQDAAERLLAELATAQGPLPRVLHAEAHRWRFAMAARPLGQTFVSDETGTLHVGGDWALGTDVTAAFQSGHAMAQDLLARLGPTR